MSPISYSPFDPSNFDQLLSMSQKLWKDFDRHELEKLLQQSIASEKYHLLMAKESSGKCVGFSMFSIRTDYVEGAVQSPTGYLEGIFVETDFRKRGIAKSFIQLGEIWCKEKGCTQMGSDTWLTDTESRAFHKRVGFWEEEEVVHFLKNIT
jgi:aminoglycoside 6'-N-acetyltransferase I